MLRTHQPNRPTPRHQLQPGDVISAARGPIHHYGVVSDRFGPDGRIMAISGSKVKGIVVEEPIDEFAGGSPVVFRGYIGGLSRQEVVARARSMIGERWDVLANNCEHVASRAHGLQPQSPQLRVAVALGVLGAVVFAALNDDLK